MQGYIQIYTGNGKGKTTASLGLALRAAGAGLKIFIIQFLKKGDYSEIIALKKLSSNITIEQYGTGKFIKGEPSESDVKLAEAGFLKAKNVVNSGDYDVVILEEANVAVSYGLISEIELLKILDNKPMHVEIVITGRNASKKIIDSADLVTEMKEIKHYYSSGVQARKGIEK